MNLYSISQALFGAVRNALPYLLLVGLLFSPLAASCGDDDDDSENGSSDLSGQCLDYCNKTLECSEWFSYVWDSVEQCQDQCQSFVNDVDAETRAEYRCYLENCDTSWDCETFDECNFDCMTAN